MSSLILRLENTPWRALLKLDRVWAAVALLFAGLAVASLSLAADSILFVSEQILGIGLFLAAAVLLAAYAKASGADGLIARAFQGRERTTVWIAAMVGALSPFCSCGVIPLIAAMLAMGVPLPAVMAFWLASPIMDPSMFLLTVGVVGTEFAVAKTFAAILVGAGGGFGTSLLIRAGWFADPLREGVALNRCGGSKASQIKPVAWRFWEDSERLQTFLRDSRKTGLFLLKWLTLAFALEFLMLRYIPAETIGGWLGADSIWALPLAVLIGVPAYLNGYAALGLIGGLLESGMAPGAGLAFLVAGGITSIPAAMAVFALARAPLFLWYLALALLGAFASGLAYQLYLAV